MEVAAGEAHGCALRVDGTLACWGWNNLGQAEPPAGNFSQVATGRSHSCAVRMDGSIACWGRNESGQSAPPNGTAFVQVAAGAAHSCALRSDSRITCWGATRSPTRSASGRRPRRWTVATSRRALVPITPAHSVLMAASPAGATTGSSRATRRGAAPLPRRVRRHPGQHEPTSSCLEMLMAGRLVGAELPEHSLARAFSPQVACAAVHRKVHSAELGFRAVDEESCYGVARPKRPGPRARRV